VLFPSLTAAYATQAVALIAKAAGEPYSAEQIAIDAGVPRPYLRKVLHALQTKGLLITRRGHRGGYRLARPSWKISLFEVLSAVDGVDAFERCLLGLGRCSSKRGCPVHVLWSDHRRRIKDRYQELTLAELAEFDRFDVERDYHFACSNQFLGQRGGP
jgi:Rrf2 family protein